MTNNTDKQGATMTLKKGLAAFLDAMLGKNRSSATFRAYRTDVLQFMTFLHENNVAITNVGDVGKVDVLEYLAALARKGLSGVARARKVSAIREYFRFLEGVGVIQKSPIAGIDGRVPIFPVRLRAEPGVKWPYVSTGSTAPPCSTSARAIWPRHWHDTRKCSALSSAG